MRFVAFLTQKSRLETTMVIYRVRTDPGKSWNSKVVVLEILISGTSIVI